MENLQSWIRTDCKPGYVLSLKDLVMGTWGHAYYEDGLVDHSVHSVLEGMEILVGFSKINS